MPSARVGHIGIYRNPETLQPVEYYLKVPEDIAERRVIVVDPMLATGNSVSAAIQRLKDKGAKDIKLVCLLSAPEGIRHVNADHPDVQIFTAAIKHRFSDSLTLTNQTQISHSTTDARETAPQAVLTGPLATSPALSNGNFTTLSPSQLFIKLQSHDRVIENHAIYNDTTDANFSSLIKVAAPNMLCRVLDLAIQAYGGAGVTEDFGLAAAYASARALRIVDGPDEVHRNQIAKLELRKYRVAEAKRAVERPQVNAA